MTSFLFNPAVLVAPDGATVIGLCSLSILWGWYPSLLLLPVRSLAVPAVFTASQYRFCFVVHAHLLFCIHITHASRICLFVCSTAFCFRRPCLDHRPNFCPSVKTCRIASLSLQIFFIQSGLIFTINPGCILLITFFARIYFCIVL